jgi:3-deoxy-D-manno-octulosonic-acid transferase
VKFLFSIIYQVAIHLLTLCLAPKLIYDYVRYGKYRTSLRKRLGRDFPKISNLQGRKVIWFHAVSVGETKAIAPLVKLWREKDPQAFLLISSVTETGHAEAKRSIKEANAYIYLPLDLPYIIKPLVRAIRPDRIIICETDLWYNFLSSAKRLGARIAVVNGKISERSFGRYFWIKGWAQYLLNLPEMWCLQSEVYKERFLQLGLKEKKLRVTGNLKLDHVETEMAYEQKVEFKETLGLQNESLTIVVGSTHPKEEKLILQSLKALWSQLPTLKVILVPRHPERFNEVAQLLKKLNLSFSRYSQEIKPDSQVILIDTMGLLKQCYQVADVAIVAGSFVPIGGHNIMEPAAYGVPTIYGPYMHKQPDFLEMMRTHQGGIQVTVDTLYQTILELSLDSQLRKEQGLIGKQVYLAQQGALQRTWNHLESLESQQKGRVCNS